MASPPLIMTGENSDAAQPRCTNVLVKYWYTRCKERYLIVTAIASMKDRSQQIQKCKRGL